jgi:ubiquinone/menaquinone biosynthesis C-methylase UbiE
MQRQFVAEAMDGADLDPQLLSGDLLNLESLNRFFGGRDVIRRRVAPLIAGMKPGRPVRVLDLGSGSGDLCRVLVDECRSRNRPVEVLSLDAHPQIQEFARERCRAGYPEIRFVRGDARQVPLRERSVDLALCTLALHHFLEPDARAVLAEMHRVTRGWAVVSDLCRSRIAYAGVWAATRLTTNPMTRFDGPVSVQRAFTAPELVALSEEAAWTASKLYREPWFRMTLVCTRESR